MAKYPQDSHAHRIHHGGRTAPDGTAIGPDLAVLAWIFERPLRRLVDWLSAVDQMNDLDGGS